MKKLQKITALLLALVLALAFASCKKEEEPKPTAAPPSGTAAPPSESSTEPSAKQEESSTEPSTAKSTEKNTNKPTKTQKNTTTKKNTATNKTSSAAPLAGTWYISMSQQVQLDISNEVHHPTFIAPLVNMRLSVTYNSNGSYKMSMSITNMSEIDTGVKKAVYGAYGYPADGKGATDDVKQLAVSVSSQVKGWLKDSFEDSEQGKYSVKGNTITYYDSDDTYSENFKINGNTLTISGNDDGESYSFSLKRA